MTGFSLEHSGISVNNLDNAVKWYSEKLGFKEMKRFDKAEFQVKGALLESNGTFLEIIEPYEKETDADKGNSPQAGFQKMGANHIAICTSEIGETFESFKASGAEMLSELIDKKMFFCRDPFGTFIEMRLAK